MSADGFDFDALDFEFARNEDWTEPAFEALIHIRGPEPDPWYRPRDGLLTNEVPFRSDLRLLLPEIVSEYLVSPLARSAEDSAQHALLANVLYGHARSPDTRVFYSRDRNHYAGLSQARQYLPAFYTYAQIMSGVASLEAANLIEHIKTAPSPSARLRSRISASPSLSSQIAGFPFDFVFKPKEVIVLRDDQLGPLAYSDSDRIFQMRRDVSAHNEFLASSDIRVDHPSARYDEYGFIHVNDRWLDPRRRAYYRVFNRNFSRGGRWYGAFWQSLPKDMRQYLLVRGEAVVECDYRACHLRLLCARVGVDLPFHEKDFDPYQNPGMDRSRIKVALNIMLNADTERGALGAIARELRERDIDEPYQQARTLMDAIRQQFRGLERFWCSGGGLRLQNTDADICGRVQRRLRREDIPVLSVHDSFIVPATAKCVLQDVMEEEMVRACKKGW